MSTFTFSSPVNPNEMVQMIAQTVHNIGGIATISDNIVHAKWKSARFRTTFAKRFTFYVGKDMVRVTSNATLNASYIWWKTEVLGLARLWDDFISRLIETYPNLDFQLQSGAYQIVSAKILSNGIEQTFSSTSTTSPSISRALIGGALFGGAGAVVGGSYSTTQTTGSTNTTFTNSVLVAVRYSNGLTMEGEISKKSEVYNQIMVNMSQLTE